MPVVKSDGYGHGIIEVARTIQEKVLKAGCIQESSMHMLGRMGTGEIWETRQGIWGVSVFELAEAKMLRKTDFRLPIFLLAGLLGDDAAEAIKLDITVGVVAETELHQLQKAAYQANKEIPIHIKIDTAMGRYGFTPDEAITIWQAAKQWPNLLFQGIYSHMPCADDPASHVSTAQVKKMEEITRILTRKGHRPEFIHMANSSGIARMPDAPSLFNLCRPGIGIYGAGALGSMLSLSPVMELRSTICGIRRFSGKTPLGYGQTCYVDGNSLVALVPLGYDNGYLRSLSNRGVVLVRNQRAKVLGTVCMKTILVDVTHIPGATTGDQVTIVGQQETETLLVDHLAELGGTISYELLCLFGRLNHRVYV